MPDMFDCGVYTYTTWANGLQFEERWSGPFNPALSFEEVHTPERRRQNINKLEISAQKEYERGWKFAQTQAVAAKGTTAREGK